MIRRIREWRIDRMTDREKYRTRGGYYLLMRDPQQLWEFNVDGLRGLCALAEVDWTALLAEIPN